MASFCCVSVTHIWEFCLPNCFWNKQHQNGHESGMWRFQALPRSAPLLALLSFLSPTLPPSTIRPVLFLGLTEGQSLICTQRKSSVFKVTLEEGTEPICPGVLPPFGG